MVLLLVLVKLLETVVPDNLSNWVEYNKKLNKQQNGFRKNRSTNDNLFELFERELNLTSTRVLQLQISVLISTKSLSKFG